MTDPKLEEAAREYALKQAYYPASNMFHLCTTDFLAGARWGLEEAARYILVGAHGFNMSSNECIEGIRALATTKASDDGRVTLNCSECEGCPDCEGTGRME